MIKNWNFFLNEEWGKDWNKQNNAANKGDSIHGHGRNYSPTVTPPTTAGFKQSNKKKKEKEVFDYEVFEEEQDLTPYPISDIFLKLTKTTTPNKYEDLMESVLPFGWRKDSFGNYFYKLNGKSTTMFASHLDTADLGKPKEVTHVMKKSMGGDQLLIGTDGKTILGADDKAGAAIMINMIQNKIPGLYYFFLGEERGCLGSKALLDFIEKNPNNNLYNNIDRVISFDRRGYKDVITFQSEKRCCSDEFADALIAELGKCGFSYEKDPTGSYTDSYTFINKYRECTNISVGYFHQHSPSEVQNLHFLQRLANACLKINWESLPTIRDSRKICDLRKYIFGFQTREDMISISKFLKSNGYNVYEYDDIIKGRIAVGFFFKYFGYNYKDTIFYRADSFYANTAGKIIIKDFSKMNPKEYNFKKSNFVDDKGNEIKPKI